MPKLKMTEQEIYDYTKKFVKEAYGIELSIPVSINGRLKRLLGRYTYRKLDEKITPVKIDFSRILMENGSLKEIKSVARHEAIHYALSMQGRDFDDGDEDFENELRKHKSHSTESFRVKHKQLKVTYECGCGNQWIYRRRLSRSYTYSCPNCKNDIVETKREHVFC